MVTDPIALDGMLGLKVSELIEAAHMQHLIGWLLQEHGVMEFNVVTTLPFEAWSSGEQAIWQWVRSLRKGETHDLIRWTARGFLAKRLVSVFGTAMGVKL